MKKICCELCGSNDFVKDGGMFVCQSCGTKYTLEEAKKLMIEGTVEVTGTVTVDNREKVNNLLVLAQRAKRTNDSKTAAQYYQQLLLEEPDNWEAAFYTIFYDAHNNKIAQIGEAANRVGNSLPAVFEQIRLLPEEEKQAATEEVAVQCCRFADMLMGNAVDFLKNNYDVKSRDTGDVFKDIADVLERNKKRMTQANEWVTPILLMLMRLEDEVKKALPDHVELYCRICVTAKKMVDLLIEKEIMKKSNTDRETTTALAMQMLGCTELYAAVLVVMDKMEEIGSVEKQLRLKRIETYWAEHAEEKEALEQKKQTLRQERDDLKAQEAQLRQRMQAFDPNSNVSLPASSQMQKLQQQRTDAYRQMNNLGLFKGKEKKALAETIARLDEEIRQLNQQVTQQIAEKKQEIQKKRQELRDAQQELQPRLSAIEKELKEIENELTKDR